MSNIDIRISGRAGRITFTRPQALNALSPGMSLAMEEALDAWRADPAVQIVVIDAEGERAFCAGGDIADIYRHGTQGDHDFARTFWRQEYRMNAKIAAFPKPVVALMQGFTMGGGVGVGCHASHRIVGETAQIAMPECGIGLIPDVGGSWLLGRAPGALGEYLGLTAARMSASDAIFAGFADTHVPQGDWPTLIAALEASADTGAIAKHSANPGASTMQAQMPEIDACFSAGSLPEITEALETAGTPFSEAALKPLRRNAPLAMACTLELVRKARSLAGVPDALAQEYRYTHRAQAQGDFLEGIRAQVIDKDRTPKWVHDGPTAVTEDEVQSMLAPLGPDELDLKGVSQ